MSNLPRPLLSLQHIEDACKKDSLLQRTLTLTDALLHRKIPVDAVVRIVAAVCGGAAARTRDEDDEAAPTGSARGIRKTLDQLGDVDL